MKREDLGKYGGKVLRAFTGPAGKKFVPGAILTPEETENWPVNNRVALHSADKVDWFGPPSKAALPKKAEKEKTAGEQLPVSDDDDEKQEPQGEQDTPPAKTASRRKAPARRAAKKK